MNLMALTVTACKKETAVENHEVLAVPAEVREFANSLAKAEPAKMLVTGQLVQDHYTLHWKVQEKLAAVASGRFTLNLDFPTKLAHRVNPVTGVWQSVGAPLGIVYELLDRESGGGGSVGFIGFGVEAEEASVA